MASPFYQKFKAKTKEMLEHLPDGATLYGKENRGVLSSNNSGYYVWRIGLRIYGPINRT